MGPLAPEPVAGGGSPLLDIRDLSRPLRRPAGRVGGNGVIVLAGVPISGLPPHARARLGVSRTFQNIRLFGELTVRESVRVARYARTRAGVLAALARTPAMRRERRSADLAVSALATEPSSCSSTSRQRA
jgi:ABC-type uncharacterized transport system ATPase subunit